MTVIFSTYQSIDVIAKAQRELLQKDGFGEFDLVICDEAHRTTGVTLVDEDESAFVKVHNDNFLVARKRLYMTATPRLYGDDAKSRAAQVDAVLCSMDDTKLYGQEIYRIGFGEAVEKQLLTDYKVLILTIGEEDVPFSVRQKMRRLQDERVESAKNEKEKKQARAQKFDHDDISKLIGTVNAIAKQIIGDEGITKEADPAPMRRAVAFCQKIKHSKEITDIYNTATEPYIEALAPEQREQMVSVESKHIDGTMSAPERDGLLSWLKEDAGENQCRVLTNVRCLSEGVDVPSLDAVMFLSPRNSPVEVVQSVGRVMRVSPGKKYGYIIIPVIVPSEEEAEEALDKSDAYKVVWTVLNALRAHDDRFNATVNQIELNKTRPSKILIGGAPTCFDEEDRPVQKDPAEMHNKEQEQMLLRFQDMQNILYARLVKKVGDRYYWEQWASDVAKIAQLQISDISNSLKTNTTYDKEFNQFLDGLQKNINPSISRDDAIEMLAQHIITRPVFEALFEGYSFADENVISQSMQRMLDLLGRRTLEKDSEKLQKFYASVRERVKGLNNGEARQRVIVELYDKFFRTAFPRVTEKLEGVMHFSIDLRHVS